MFMYSEDAEKLIKNTSKVIIDSKNDVTNSIGEYLYTAIRAQVTYKRHLYHINYSYDKDTNFVSDLDVYNFTNKKFMSKNTNILISEYLKPILLKLAAQN